MPLFPSDSTEPRPADSESTDVAGGSNSNGPHKPAPRILLHGLATREEVLFHVGEEPALQEDDMVFDGSQIGLDDPDDSHGEIQQSIIPSMPFVPPSRSRLDTLAQSESSATGDSFSEPTESIHSSTQLRDDIPPARLEAQPPQSMPSAPSSGSPAATSSRNESLATGDSFPMPTENVYSSSRLPNDIHTTPSKARGTKSGPLTPQFGMPPTTSSRHKSSPRDYFKDLSDSIRHIKPEKETRMRELMLLGGEMPLWPWAYEFNWTASGLSFGGEPFVPVRRADSKPTSSRTVIATKAPPASFTSTCPSPQEPPQNASRLESSPLPSLETLSSVSTSQIAVLRHRFFNSETSSECKSNICTDITSELAEDLDISSDLGENLDVDSDLEEDPDVPEHSLAVIAWHRNIDWLVELLLDRYIRSRAPERSGRRNNAAQQQASAPTRGSSRSKRSNSSRAAGQNGGRKRGAVGGSGDGEDEEPPQDGQWPPPTTSEKGSARFACPYYKWKRDWAEKGCKVKLKKMSHLRGHLQSKHYKPYCHTCYRELSSHQAVSCHSRAAPLGFMTDEKLAIISKGVDRTQDHVEQWQHWFRVLFPGEPIPSSPYLDHRMVEELENADSWWHSAACRKAFGDALEEIGIKGDATKIEKVRRVVHERWRVEASEAALLRTASTDEHGPEETEVEVTQQASDALFEGAPDVSVPDTFLPANTDGEYPFGLPLGEKEHTESNDSGPSVLDSWESHFAVTSWDFDVADLGSAPAEAGSWNASDDPGQFSRFTQAGGYEPAAFNRGEMAFTESSSGHLAWER